MVYLMDALIGIFIAIIIIIYAKRGAVKSLYGLLTTVAACVAAFILGPVVASLLIKPFMGGAEDTVYNALMSVVKSVEGAFDISGLFEQLPEQFTALIERCGGDIASLQDKFGGITAGTEADVRMLAQTIAGPIITYASKAIGYVLVYIAATIVMCILKAIILPIFKLPVLKQADGFLGFVIGIVAALTYTWIICMAISAVVELGMLGEYNETLASLAKESFIFRFFCNLSPLELVNITSVFN